MPVTPNFEGRLIGSYRLVKRIGEGGMGEVYLAERENEFRKRVAIKLIKSGMANPEVVRRFVIERQTLAALNHPNIVRLTDGGATPDGLPYLVVDYVDGAPIDLYCDGRKLSISDRLRLFIDVSMAVHHAHQSLIVHCDLKPGNILVTPQGMPMLLDFGLAKLLDPVAAGISLQTAKTLLRAYTPDYASPEQLRGEPVTTASDIYSLGVVLYELLTGHSPYRVPGSESLADWVRCVCEQDAEPPSAGFARIETRHEEDGRVETLTPERVSQVREGAPSMLRRRLRGDLDAIVLKALRKEPAERYGSVDQMAEDIRRHLDGRPVLARRNSAPYVVRKFLRRHKLVSAAAVLLALTLTGGVAATLWQARVAARRFEDLRRLAHAFLFDVHDSIQDLPGSTAARALIARTGTEYLDRLALDAGSNSSLELELAEGYLKIGEVEGDPYSPNLGDTARAVENYRKALRIAESAWARNRSDPKARRIVARSHENLASVLPFSGRAAEALEHAKRAGQLFREVAAAQPADPEAQLDAARAIEMHADILGGLQGLNLGRIQEAAEVYNQALAMIPSLPSGHPSAPRAVRARAVGLVKIGDIEERAGNFSDALAKYKTALASTDELLQADPSSARLQATVAGILSRVAAAEGSVGAFQAAGDYYQRAIDISEKQLLAEPANEKARANVITVQKNLGDLYYYSLNQMPGALRAYRRAEELLEIECRTDPRKIVYRQLLAEVLSCVASCLLATGQPQEARRGAQRSLQLAKEVADSPEASADQVYNYAWLAVSVDPEDLRNPAAALPYARKAVEMDGPPRPLHLHVLAQAYAGTGDYRLAVKTEERALQLFHAGEAVTRTQEVIQRTLGEFREELARSGGLP